MCRLLNPQRLFTTDRILVWQACANLTAAFVTRRHLPTREQVQGQESQHAHHNGQEHVAAPKVNGGAHCGAHPSGVHPSVQKLTLSRQNFRQDHRRHGRNGCVLQATLRPIGQSPFFAREEKETARQNGHARLTHNHSQGPQIGAFKETHAAAPWCLA